MAGITKPALPVVTSFPQNPLTTTFVRPSDCDGIYASLFLSGVDFSTSCMPKGFHTAETSYFSPGLVCPSGYYSACHDTIGVKSITTVTCCPVVSELSLSCVTASTLVSVWSTLFCTWIAPNGAGTVLPLTSSANGVTSTERRKFTSPDGLNAFGIRMVYQSTDLLATTSVTTTTQGVSTTQSTTRRPIATKTGVDPDPSPSDSSGLSTGAKAAIGVIVPLAALGLLAGFFFWWRRRRQYKAVQQPSPSSEFSAPHPHATPISELHVTPTSELPGSMQRQFEAVELPTH